MPLAVVHETLAPNLALEPVMSEREVFTAALQIADPAERSAYLNQACAGDAALRQRIEMLLETQGHAGDFLEQPALMQMAGGAVPDQDATAADDPAAQPAPASPSTEPGDDEKDAPLDFLQPSTKPNSLGRLGHYEVLEVLGHGGFGIVLKAFDEMLHRVVAVKVMAPRLAATSPARKRFLREARASAAIRHENVVAIYAVEEQPIPYLVMEFIAGETLQQKLDRLGPLDAEEVVRIGRQIAEGLAGAHAMGLIHRDIKPSNILLEKGIEEKVKITDFGLARAADDASLTQSGVIAGTPMYMAPEQAKGETIDQRADLFSLGSVLYVMCSGRPPFRASTTLAVLKRVAEDEPRPIREIIPEVPEWLCAIIAKLHAKKPEDRFATAKEVADLLARCLAELQGPVGVPSLPHLARAADHPRRDRKPRPRWLVPAGVALLLVALIAVGLWAGGVFKAKTAAGVLVIQVNEPNPEVYVDGERVPVSWDEDGKKAEVRVRQGTHKVEVKKHGFTVYSEEVTLADGKPDVVMLAQLRPLPPKASEWTVGKGARFASLRDAVLDAPAGSRIEVQPGSYREKPIVLLRDVEIVGMGPREKVLIRWEEGTGITSLANKVTLRGLTLSAENGSVVSATAGDCRLEDCDLSQSGGAHATSLLEGRGKDTSVYLTGCDLHDASSDCGIWANKCHVTAERCTIKRTGLQGIYMQGGVLKLVSCTVSETRQNNLWAHDHTQLDASDCIFSKAPVGYASVVMSGETKGKLVRCRIIDGGSYGFGISAGGTALLDDCHVERNQFGLEVKTDEENSRRLGFQGPTMLTVTNSHIIHNKGPGLTMKEQAQAVVTGCNLTGNTGGAWDIAPTCTIQREKNTVDPE